MTSPSNSRSVLIIVENLGVPFDRRVWLEATTLSKAGYTVSVICPAGMGYPPGYELLEGVHVYRHPLNEASGGIGAYLREYVLALYWEFRLSARVFRERGFQAVHICNPPDLMFLVAALYKYLFRTRVVFDHHDVNPELYEDKYGRRDAFYYLLRVAERLTFAVADTVISTNDSFRCLAIERGGKRAEDVFVVRSAPDLDRFRRMEPQADYRNGREHLVGYVGVMGEQDGVDLLLKSAAVVVHEYKRDVQFMLVGGGPSLPYLKGLAADLELEDHVEFSGFQQGDELLSRLSACDIGVSPDPATPFNSMCTMNKILEYMALELPVVLFDLKEGRESARGAALYACNNDPHSFAGKLVELLDDPERRARMGALGRQRMERELGWHHQRTKLLAAYEKLTR